MITDKDNNTVHCSKSGPWLNYRCEGIVNANIEDAKDLFLSTKVRKEFDPYFEKGEYIKKIDDTTSILHLNYKDLFKWRGRDFYLLSTCEKLDDGRIIMAAKSVENSENDFKNPKKIRAKMRIGTWVLEKVKNDE